ncbi:LIC_12616 family protein [Sporosarcina contaminans]|uniref:LIC_12616 family protein n=1 Tax=Sporosarcina contaminans TaxID=633403 RepID=A0ABW3U1Z2_9BACL
MIEQIRKQILKDTGILVIPANTTAKKPDMPYATINATSPWIDDRGHADTLIYTDETGTHMKRNEAYQMVFSINVYAADEATTIQIARTLRSWFVMVGESFLEEMNVVVVNRGNIENRTTFILDSYEHKHGFDVRMRATDGQVITKMPIIPDDAVTNPDGSVTFPDGSILNPDGSIEKPDGTIIDPVGYDWIEKVIIEYKGVE